MWMCIVSSRIWFDPLAVLLCRVGRHLPGVALLLADVLLLLLPLLCMHHSTNTNLC
jgi:hypothetical protein